MRHCVRILCVNGRAPFFAGRPASYIKLQSDLSIVISFAAIDRSDGCRVRTSGKSVQIFVCLSSIFCAKKIKNYQQQTTTTTQHRICPNFISRCCDLRYIITLIFYCSSSFLPFLRQLVLYGYDRRWIVLILLFGSIQFGHICFNSYYSKCRSKCGPASQPSGTN